MSRVIDLNKSVYVLFTSKTSNIKVYFQEITSGRPQYDHNTYVRPIFILGLQQVLVKEF